jgi:outer membrane receptor protein involved in Fe transport
MGGEGTGNGSGHRPGRKAGALVVLVDGVRVSENEQLAARLSAIPASMIERIEIVRGGASVLWGEGASGGVINVITRRGARDGWAAEVGYGDYDTRQASLNGGVATERLELDLGISWLDSAGFPTRTLDDTDRGYENLSASAQLRADLGPAEVALRHWRAEGTSEYSDFFLTPGMFGNMRLASGGATPALLVPDAAVQTDQARKTLLTVGDDGTVAVKAVQLGPVVNGLRVVRSGIAATDRVVISGTQMAMPGTRVQVRAGRIAPTREAASTAGSGGGIGAGAVPGQATFAAR